jgi:cell division protein ZapA (FtsZ GTPase activity inhibitor)
MNTIQKTAVVETAKVIGIITGIVFVVSAAISLLSLGAVAAILLMYCLVVCVKAIYTIKLGEAQVKQMEIDAEIDRLHK